jgi:shikimate dehydrogenase
VNLPPIMVERYSVIGNPIEHSQSPFIFAQFAQQTGHVIEYGRVLSPVDTLKSTLEFCVSQGLLGCNVTMPFKFEAFTLASTHSARARQAQAANVLSFAKGQYLADNTDGVGLVRDIEQNAGMVIKGKDILLLGAGGAAAGALGALLTAQPARVVLANRTLDKAQALVKRHTALAHQMASTLEAAPLTQYNDAPQQTIALGFDLIINASSTSLQGQSMAITPTLLKPNTLVLDMMYGAPAQPFLRWAGAHQAQTRDGLGMLVEQAAEAFFIWRGLRPNTMPVLQALRERLQTQQ